MFFEWQATKGAQFVKRSDALRRYFDAYGRITPFVVVAIPAHASREFLPTYVGTDVASQTSLASLIATGRVIVVDVLGEADRLISREIGWRKLLLAENDHRIPLNNSPIVPSRFHRLMAKVLRHLSNVLNDWEGALLAENGTSDKRVQVPPSPYYFVSYARANSQMVVPICAELRNAGVNLWFDTDSIPAGENFLTSMTVGVEGSQCILPFCSKEQADSKWCLREANFADQIGKTTRPIWLTNPALFKEMRMLLGIYNAVLIAGLSPQAAAVKIKNVLPAAP